MQDIEMTDPNHPWLDAISAQEGDERPRTTIIASIDGKLGGPDCAHVFVLPKSGQLNKCSFCDHMEMFPEFAPEKSETLTYVGDLGPRTTIIQETNDGPEVVTLTSDALEALERPEFERWAKIICLDVTETTDAWGRRVYKHDHIQSMWGAWLARSALIAADPETARQRDIAVAALRDLKDRAQKMRQAHNLVGPYANERDNRIWAKALYHEGKAMYEEARAALKACGASE